MRREKLADATVPSSQQSEIAKEQTFVDRAYKTLDEMRVYYRRRQDEVAAEMSSNPSARADRDALAAHYGDAATRLESVENRLVFGGLNLNDGTSFHIGRIGLRDFDPTDAESATPELSPTENSPADLAPTSPEKLADMPGEGMSRQLLVDWRAKVAQPFYQATAVAPMGVWKRRHVATSLRQVVGVEDELLTSSPDTDAVQTATLQGEGALMAALSRARSGQMSDIVSTIQAEQDRVIRSDLNAFLVVQGGPGTGKTAVALHRAAYLLYAHRDQLDSQGVLVVGPNHTFLRYIERVLPALGETGVVSLTIGECFPGAHTVAERPELRALKGDTRWIKVAAAAVADLKRPPREDQMLQLDHVQLNLSAALIRDAMEAGSHGGSTHNQHWAAYAKFLVRELTKLYAGQTPTKEDMEWMTEEIRASAEVRRAVNRCYLPASAPDLLARLYAYPDYLQRIASGIFTAEEIAALQRPKTSPFTDADVPILDELAELLGPLPGMTDSATQRRNREQREIERAAEAIEAMDLGGGLINARMLARSSHGEVSLSPLAQRARADRSWAYGHVVVDEAQELSPMDWHLLLRRCPSRSFTVVGDVNQTSQRSSTPLSWETLLGPARRAAPVMEQLTINYRTPRAVMDLAQKVLAATKHTVVPLQSARDVADSLVFTRLQGEPHANLHEPVSGPGNLVPTLRETLQSETARLEAEVGSDAGKLAIIVPAAAHSYLAATLGLETADVVADQVCCLDPRAAKGLEFDTVILVEPAVIADQSAGDLYVAMTRCTKRMHVLASVLPAGMELCPTAP
ncbi:AAA family ATPase [Mobiluncus curtisii]|uniref:AAA family ATPase n=1 Tax=Mobiluncus curtisii TaxID=2051 RepID=A0A7Y0UIB0_9ACTO|nr:AAA family ATPase [Mobiluncus curtisii]NMW49449.1 AAA family ATPase [Mobiluncus curtisii]NMW87859.1 AAA family ATPase [Mobiluncus curtisii]